MSIYTALLEYLVKIWSKYRKNNLGLVLKCLQNCHVISSHMRKDLSRMTTDYRRAYKNSVSIKEPNLNFNLYFRLKLLMEAIIAIMTST